MIGCCIDSGHLWPHGWTCIASNSYAGPTCLGCTKSPLPGPACQDDMASTHVQLPGNSQSATSIPTSHDACLQGVRGSTGHN